MMINSIFKSNINIKQVITLNCRTDHAILEAAGVSTRPQFSQESGVEVGGALPGGLAVGLEDGERTQKRYFAYIL